MAVAFLDRSKESAGSNLDLEALFDEHYTRLVRMASFYTDSTESAEEVVQDAFVKLLKGNYKIEEGREAPYLRSMVLNGARSTLRKRKVRRDYKPEPTPNAPAAEIAGVANAASEEMLEALRQLPEKQASVLVLRYYLDLSEAEIADTLDIARGSVKSHAHRGLAKLATLVKDLS